MSKAPDLSLPKYTDEEHKFMFDTLTPGQRAVMEGRCIHFTQGDGELFCATCYLDAVMERMVGEHRVDPGALFWIMCGALGELIGAGSAGHQEQYEAMLVSARYWIQRRAELKGAEDKIDDAAPVYATASSVRH